jgi:hypothetical protein
MSAPSSAASSEFAVMFGIPLSQAPLTLKDRIMLEKFPHLPQIHNLKLSLIFLPRPHCSLSMAGMQNTRFSSHNRLPFPRMG